MIEDLPKVDIEANGIGTALPSSLSTNFSWQEECVGNARSPSLGEHDVRLRRTSTGSMSSSENLALAAAASAAASAIDAPSSLSVPLIPISPETKLRGSATLYYGGFSVAWSLASCLLGYANRNRLLIAVLLSWYLLGVVAIVTTKLLLTEWQVPPLVLTFQQLLLASGMLRLRLSFSAAGAQPMPTWRSCDEPANPKGREDTEEGVPLKLDPSLLGSIPEHEGEECDDDSSVFLDFVLAGLFNAMDFLASNTAFSASAANFVESIKASDPITTTTVALLYKVDRLGGLEAGSMVLLVSGLLLSTWGNGGDLGHGDATVIDESSWELSLRSALLVVVANFSFAFRAMTQKLYQHRAKAPLNDENLLCRLQQIGWLSLLLPLMAVYPRTLRDAFFEDNKVDYLKLSLVNSFAYASYNLASTYVLSQLTVIQHSTLSCLRRLFVIVMTCLFFGVPLTFLGCTGILMSFAGFCAFTHFRRKRRLDDAKSLNVE